MNAITRVMVIEDDIADYELHHRYLEQMGGLMWSGLRPHSPEALMQLDILKPDLVLLMCICRTDADLIFWTMFVAVIRAVMWFWLPQFSRRRQFPALERGGVVDYLPNQWQFRLSGTESTNRINKNLKSVRLKSRLSTRCQSHQGRRPWKVSILAYQRIIDGVTPDKIRVIFQQADIADITADEAGERIGASRTTARTLFEFLITNWRVMADLNGGTVGRPNVAIQAEKVVAPVTNGDFPRQITTDTIPVIFQL